MAREIIESKTFIEENAKDAPVRDIQWKASQINTESDTHLEDDQGHGDAAVIRCFTFGVNLEAFKRHTPTKQELFNSHYKGIEAMLWRDGMKVIPEINPKIIMKKKFYQIFVGARPQRGHLLRERPRILADIAHNRV